MYKTLASQYAQHQDGELKRQSLQMVPKTQAQSIQVPSQGGSRPEYHGMRTHKSMILGGRQASLADASVGQRRSIQLADDNRPPQLPSIPSIKPRPHAESHSKNQGLSRNMPSPFVVKSE